jgi:hypothetical protein
MTYSHFFRRLRTKPKLWAFIWFFQANIPTHNKMIKWLIPTFLEDYELNQNFELSFDSFKLTFQHITKLSTSGPFKMALKHLWVCFHPKDSASGFPQSFQLYSHVAQGHIQRWIAHTLGPAHLLAMTKPLGGIHPITIGETLYWLTSHVLCFQFCNAFVTHFSPH